MKCKFVLFATACLSYLLAPSAGSSLGLVIGGHAGASMSSGGEVVLQSKPSHVVHTVPVHQQVVLQHKPVSLVPLATIPSYSITDRLARLWGGISDSIGGKIRAVGDFFKPPPRVVLVNVETKTPKPTTTHKPTKKPCPPHPVLVEVVAGVPHYRYISVLEDCDKN